MIVPEVWMAQVEQEAQKLVGQPRGTDDEVRLRMGTYLLAFIGLAKAEGLTLDLQIEIVKWMNERAIVLDARGAAIA